MIRSSLGRFITLVSIVTIGVAFFVGVSGSSPIMSYSVDTYNDSLNLKDITLYSNYGFDDEDIDAIESLDSVSKVEGTYFVDVRASSEDETRITRIHAYNKDSTINDFELVEGRLPENEHEALAEAGTELIPGFLIGTTVTFESDSLSTDYVEIVGTINTPLYLNETKESSTIQNQDISTYLYVPVSAFDTSVYTEVNVLTKEGKQLSSFSDAYESYNEDVKEELKKLAKTHQSDRVNKIKAEAQEELDASKQELEEGWQELEDAKATLSESQATLDRSYVSAKAQLDLSYSSWQEGTESLESAKAELANQESQIEQAKSSLTTIDETILSLDLQISALKEEDENRSVLEQQKQELESQKEAIESSVQAFDSAKAEIETNEATLSSAYQSIVNGYATLESETASAQAQIDAGWTEIEANEAELESAQTKIDEAQEEIDAMDEGKWTILTRESHYASVTYKATIEQMRAIGNIFPVFFILVAALVCMTTMKRMVDEQRTEIGTLRALGYTRLQCTMKYIIYALIATIIGEVLGCVIGLLTFPAIIYNAWEMMYILPDIRLIIPWDLIIESSIAFIGGMTLTTWLTARNDMKEVPASLMRPKAVSVGKKIFLEHVSFVWERLSFTWKVTIRNMVRYRKRFAMTVIGVVGCTALLMTGFGVRDAVSDVATIHYHDILKYQGSAQLEEDSDGTSVLKSYEKNTDVSSAQLSYGYSGKVDGEVSNIHIYEDNASLKKDYNLRVRTNHQSIKLENDGVILSEKLSERLGVEVGDTVELACESGDTKTVKVMGIAEMYVQHHVFMSTDYYEQIFGENPTTVIMTLHIDGDTEAVQEALTDDGRIASVDFYEAQLENFNNMIHGLDLIVWTLIVCSMLLAFVVLTNLMNVNIAERQREIATLKVLGFRPKEVQSYIYKENNILVVIGALVGLPVGVVLKTTIMDMVEMDYIMFGRSIAPISYVYSFVLTVIFGFIVNRFMDRKLKKIEMVDSLKSVE